MHTTPTTVNSYNTNTYNGFGNINYGYVRNSTFNYTGFGSSSSHTIISPGSVYSTERYQSIVIIKLLQTNKKYPLAFKASVILNNFKEKS